MKQNTITTITAAEAFDRYKAAYDAGLLTQGAWHIEKNGRHLACALGILGEDIDAPGKCPASVMPIWLAQMVPWFFDKQKENDAKAWGMAFYAELKRLDGKVPFSVMYDWQANVVSPVVIEAAIKRGKDPAPHVAHQAIHARALAGDIAPKEEWVKILRPAYSDAYATADAYAYATADAYAYATAYAYAYATAYAYADADAYAAPYADADADAYADAYAKAAVYYVNAAAYADAIKRLADGMVECLRRVVKKEE